MDDRQFQSSGSGRYDASQPYGVPPHGDQVRGTQPDMIGRQSPSSVTSAGYRQTGSKRPDSAGTVPVPMPADPPAPNPAAVPMQPSMPPMPRPAVNASARAQSAAPADTVPQRYQQQAASSIRPSAASGASKPVNPAVASRNIPSYRQYAATAVSHTTRANPGMMPQAPIASRQRPMAQTAPAAPAARTPPAAPSTSAVPAPSAVPPVRVAPTPPVARTTPIASKASAPRMTPPAPMRPTVQMQTSPWGHSAGNGGAPFRSGQFARPARGAGYGPFPSQVSNAPFSGAYTRTAYRKRANVGVVISIILVMALLLASGMAVQGMHEGMTGYREAVISPSASPSSDASHSPHTDSWDLPAQQVCANVSSAVDSLDGWTGADSTEVPAKLTTLKQDQSTCAGDVSSLSSADLDAMSNHTIDALIAWNADIVEFYEQRSATITYRINGKWPVDTDELEALLDSSSWSDDPTYAVQQAAKLKSANDAVFAKINEVITDLHADESKVASVQISHTASEQEIWAAIDTVTKQMGVTYSFEPLTLCGSSNGEHTVAFFCNEGSLSFRNRIMFNTGYKYWGWGELGGKGDPWMLDATKHELSHRSISIMCGTSRPTIAGERYEAVTNAYAYLFMGVDRQWNEQHQLGLEEYAVGDAEMDIAQKIHDGTCS